MPLKLKKSETPSKTLPPKDESRGSWGRIKSEPHQITTLRLCKQTSTSTEKTYSYPYRVLTSWRWHGHDGVEEELRIEASSDLITVKGRGLDRLVEALDQGALEVVRENLFDSHSTVEEQISVSSIQIEHISPKDWL